MNQAIQSYNESQTGEEKKICDILMKEIDLNLPEAESKVWHGSPVWFLDDNPVAGYSKLKDGIQLLFWSGQSFEEPRLKPVGKNKAAEIRFTNAEHMNPEDLKRWLAKSKNIQWDYKNIRINKGKLLRI